MSADQRLGLNDRAQLEVEFEAARRLSRRRFLMAAGAMGGTAGAVGPRASPDGPPPKIRPGPGSIDIGTPHVEFYMRVLDLLEPLDLSRIPNYQTIWPA